MYGGLATIASNFPDTAVPQSPTKKCARDAKPRAAAVRTAIRNAAALGFASRAHFFVGDWGTAVSGKFEAIVANPPYIASAHLRLLPREVAYHDPWRAL